MMLCSLVLLSSTGRDAVDATQSSRWLMSERRCGVIAARSYGGRGLHMPFSHCSVAVSQHTMLPQGNWSVSPAKTCASIVNKAVQGGN